MTTRRLVLSRSAILLGTASSGLLLPEIVRAQSSKTRVGLMLPYTGTFAPVGVAVENGFRLAIDQQGLTGDKRRAASHKEGHGAGDIAGHLVAGQ